MEKKRYGFLMLMGWFVVVGLMAFVTNALADVADTVESVAGKIPLEGPVIAVAAMILELVMRLTKTEKPLSIVHFLGRMFRAVGRLVLKVGDLLDKLLPQNAAQKDSLPPAL